GLAKLEADVPKAAEEHQARLLGGLGQAYLQAQATEDAARVWRQLATKQPQHLRLRLGLLELALQGGRQDEADQLLDELRRIEGDTGSSWCYGKALQLVEQAKPKKGAEVTVEGKRLLGEARAYLEETAKRRRTWHAVSALQGHIDDLDGLP